VGEHERPAKPGSGGAAAPIPVSDRNPVACQPTSGHDFFHRHGEDCGHEAIAHGDHFDYVVDGRLHAPHGGHCDDHGPA
jgi:hypothetical protein